MRQIQIEKQKIDESNLESNSKNHIGYIKSVFKERNGTPRQGIIVPNSRGVIHFHNSVNSFGKLLIDHKSFLFFNFKFIRVNERFGKIFSCLVNLDFS